MKSTLDSKSIDSRHIQGITDGSIEFDPEGGERHCIIIRTNVLLKVCGPVGPNYFSIGIDTCLSEEYSNRFLSIIRVRQLDSTLGATHREFGILSGGFLQTLLFPVKGIAMRAARSKKNYKNGERYMIFIGPKE